MYRKTVFSTVELLLIILKKKVLPCNINSAEETVSSLLFSKACFHNELMGVNLALHNKQYH